MHTLNYITQYYGHGVAKLLTGCRPLASVKLLLRLLVLGGVITQLFNNLVSNVPSTSR